VSYSFHKIDSKGGRVRTVAEFRYGNRQIGSEDIVGPLNRVISSDWIAVNKAAEDVRKV
jgi:hypothetical protein